MFVGTRYPPLDATTYERMIDVAFATAIQGDHGEVYSKTKVYHLRLAVPTACLDDLRERTRKRRVIKVLSDAFTEGFSYIAVW